MLLLPWDRALLNEHPPYDAVCPRPPRHAARAFASDRIGPSLCTVPPRSTPPPELRLLRYFVGVAEQLSFTRAAADLLIAQPSLSAAVRQLERQVGTPLFDRDNRHVELTPAGRALLPHAREALAAADRGARAARAAAKGTIEVMRIVYTQPLEPIALAALDRLDAQPEPPSITARSLWAGELVRELSEAHADLGLVRFPDEPDKLDRHVLRGDRVCALIAEDHPAAAAGRVVSFAELATRPVVEWAPELGLDQYNAFVAAAFEGHDVESLMVSRLDLAGFLPVVNGRAVALIGAAERTPGGAVKVAIRDAPRMPLAVAWAAGPRPALAEAFADAVQTSVDALQPPGPPSL